MAVSAGGTLDVGTTQAQSQGSDRASNSAAYDHNDTVQVTSSIQGKAITLASQNDMKLQGAQVSASDTLNVAAGGDLQIAAAKNVKTSAVRNNHNGSDYKEDNYDETVVGSQLQAKNNVSLQANGQNGKGNLSIVGSSVGSENGELNLSATKAITLGAETERHESHRELHNSGGDFFSSSSSDEVDHTLSILAKGSVLSGDRVTATAGSDLTVRGSQVVATKDTKLQAVQGDVNLTAAQQTFAEEHERRTESSGIFSSGAGITIGSQSTKLNTDSKTLANVGSTIGSLQGNVTIGAGNNVNGQAATIISGKDTVIQGKDIKLVGAVDTQDDHLRYEESKSGLTLSLGGAAGDALTSAYSNINAASGVQDGRLKALYDYRAAKDLSKLNDPAKLKDVGLSVSIGSSRMLSDTTTHSERVNSGSVQAGGDVRITASRDLTIGTPITGTNVTLAAQTGNLNVEAGQEKGSVNSHNESSSWAVGGTINRGYFGSFSQGSGKENGTTVTNVPTIVTARDKASLASGNDTNIVGSNVAGKSVTVQTGGNLNLVSLQDTDNYNASNEGFSLNASAGTNGVKSLTGAGSYNTGTTNSNYASVTKQAGIYAGKDGFDIQVGKNTDLKGAVIASDATPDKNKLSTGTLTYSDIQNKADYNAESSGYSVGTQKGSSGYSPGIPVSGNAGSTTQSAIAPGTIVVGGKAVTPESLRRDTTTALNELGKIFDKKTVQEKQELVNLFSKEANQAIGDFAESMVKNAKTPEEKAKWKEGGEYKAILHAFASGFTSSLSGNDFLSGAIGDGISQLAQKELANIKDPILRLFASAAIGAGAAKLVGGNAKIGAISAYNGRKYNDDNHKPTTEGSVIKRDNKYYEIDANGDEQEIDTPKVGTVFWADGAYYKINENGSDEYFYKPGTVIFDNGQYWVARSDGNYDGAGQPSAGTLIYANGQPLIVDGNGKQWPADQYPDEFKAQLIFDYKQTIDENEDLLLLAIAGRDARLAEKMVGADGVQVTSKTLWKEKGSSARIDVENPNPGQRPGQIHYQDENGNKYLYDIEKGVFVDKYGVLAPRSVNDNLKNPEFAQKLKEGLEKYLGVK